MTKVFVVAVVVAACLCSGGVAGAAQPPTKLSYIETADAVCRSALPAELTAQKQLSEAAEAYYQHRRSTQNVQASERRFGEALWAVGTAESKEVIKLEWLPKPAGLDVELTNIWGKRERQMDIFMSAGTKMMAASTRPSATALPLVNETIKAVDSLPALLASYSSATKAFGFQVCGTSTH